MPRATLSASSGMGFENEKIYLSVCIYMVKVSLDENVARLDFIFVGGI